MEGVLGALLQLTGLIAFRDIRVLIMDTSDVADFEAMERAVFVVNFVDSSDVDGLEYSRDESRALVIDTAL
jgi:hypothetical protein